MEIIRVQDVDDVDEETWNGLLRRSETNEIFLTHQWLKCWSRCARTDRSPVILLAQEGATCLGIAPLMLTPRKRGPVAYTALEFLGTGEADYSDFIIEPGRKAEVLAAFTDHIDSMRNEWDLVSLQNVPEGSSTVRELQALFNQSKFGIRDLPDVICPTLVISGHEDYASDCTRKKSLKRHYNWFNRNGELSFATLESAEEIIARLPEFFDQHLERRAIAGGGSKFHRSAIRDFYRCLVEPLLEAGWLKFGVVTFDDTPLAFHFGFEYCGKFVWYKPSFNIDYMKKSPGEVLIKFLLEDAIEKKLDEFDFTIGNEAFKQRFANVSRVSTGIEAVKTKRLLWYLDLADRAQSFAKHRLPGPYGLVKKMFKRGQQPETR